VEELDRYFKIVDGYVVMPDVTNRIAEVMNLVFYSVSNYLNQL
jgi:hypothetical protein